MSLLKSPFNIFSSSSKELGHIQIKLSFPWSLPWTINALRTALAWEIIACCEQWQLVIPNSTKGALNKYENQEFINNSYEWMDGVFSRNSARILDCIAEDLSRVHPKKMKRAGW